MTDAYSAIPQLLYTYARALDRCDATLLRSVFADDAEIDMGAIYRGGADGFVSVAMSFMGAMAATRHCISNIYISGDGDMCSVEAYVDAWHLIDLPNEPRELVVQARYLQKARLVAEHWLIFWHNEVVDYGAERIADKKWYNANAELPKGTRGGNDPSYDMLTRGDTS